MQRSAPDGTGLTLTPELAQFGEYWALVLELEAILTSEARDRCPSCSAAGHLVDGRAHGRPSPVRPLAHIPDGTDPDGAAAILAGELAAGTGACALFAALLRREVTLRTIGPHMRDPATYVRNGQLLAGTILCARTTAVLSKPRVIRHAGILPWNRIISGEPIGPVLAPHGLRPGHRVIEVIPGGNPAVKAKRELRLGSARIGTVTEEISESLCQRLAVASA